MERIPKNKPESNESAERTPRYRTIEREVLEEHEDGSKTERWLECNGKTHRGSVQRISPGGRGEFDYVDEISREDLGPCDGKHST
jgi:hypothetical protein